MFPFSTLQSWSGAPLLSPPASRSASLSAGHETRDQAVMTCVTQTWRGFSRLNVTNYEYVQGTINLFNCPGKVTHSEPGNKKHNGHLMTSGVMCPVTGAGERSRGVIMIDISAGDTSAIWHVRWQGITRKIRLGGRGNKLEKYIQLIWKNIHQIPD